jgi:hypothetical protein
LWFRRRRPTWDEQPTASCAVLLASDAPAAPPPGSGPVAVVTLAKIYGTRFGVPHPGLLPTKDELVVRQRWVAKAIDELRKHGVAEADGQVAATRKPAWKLANIARVRGAAVVVIDGTPSKGLRRVVEGDVGLELRRKLRTTEIDVEVVPRSPG